MKGTKVHVQYVYSSTVRVLHLLSRELAWIDGTLRVESFGFISPLTLSHQRKFRA